MDWIYNFTCQLYLNKAEIETKFSLKKKKRNGLYYAEVGVSFQKWILEFIQDQLSHFIGLSLPTAYV